MQAVKDISQLAAAIESIQHRSRLGGETHLPPSAFISTGWTEIDHTLGGGLMRGAVHEWFGLAMPTPFLAAKPPGLPLPERERAGVRVERTMSLEFSSHEQIHSKPLSNVMLADDSHTSPSPQPSPLGRGSPGRFAADSFFNLPPLAILIHLAWQAMESSSHAHPHSLIIWIGKRCWPHPRAMIRSCDPSFADSPFDHRLLDRSLFIDPPDDASRLWAIDLALRSPGTCAVIADGSDFDMAATRRLQLAAGIGRTPALLARPLRDLRRLSSATTRWMTFPDGSRLDKNIQNIRGRWTIELLRCKGVRPVMPGPTRWALELNHVTGALDLHASLVHRLAETA